MAPLLNVGKEPLDGYEESQATRAAAIEKIKEEGLLKSTGKDVPAPLIAAVSLVPLLQQRHMHSTAHRETS